MRRRSLLTAVLALPALPVLAACGGGETTTATPTATPSATEGAGVFPVTVTHEYGETVVPAAPQRIVTVGVTEQDIVLQLGVVPVGVTEWYGEKPDATWPWAHDLLDGAHPEVLGQSDGLEFERIAALKPDLIVGTNAGLSEKDYTLLSAIAPTVMSVEGGTDYFSPWQDQTRQIALAMGKQAEGEAIVAEVEDAYAAAAAAHPEWAGLTATFSQGGPYEGILYVYPADLATEFLTALGFTMTTGLEEYAPEGSQAEISAENVGLIEADVIVFATEDPASFRQLMAFGTISSLGAVREHRAVYTDGITAGAIYFLTPLSLMYTLERLVPALESAVAGTAPRAYPA